MSTRCQLRFVKRPDGDHDEAPDRIAQVYRHSDGYPESVLPDLFQLKQLLDRTTSERGPDYAAAQFIFLGKLRTMSMYLGRDPDMSIRAIKPADVLEPGNWAHLNQPAFLLGHGIENPSDGIHGDEEAAVAGEPDVPVGGAGLGGAGGAPDGGEQLPEVGDEPGVAGGKQAGDDEAEAGRESDLSVESWGRPCATCGGTPP